MYISDFRLVDILRDKMGEQEARTLVEYIETRVEEKYSDAKNAFASKEDLLKLEMKILESIHKNSLETQKLIADSRSETLKLVMDSKSETLKLISESRSDTQKQFGETNKSIAETKSDMLKWMFGMIITSTVAIIGTILAVMRMGGWGD